MSTSIHDVFPGWGLRIGQNYGARQFVRAWWVVCTFASNKRGLNKMLSGRLVVSLVASLQGRGWSSKVVGALTECPDGVVMAFLAEGT